MHKRRRGGQIKGGKGKGSVELAAAASKTPRIKGHVADFPNDTPPPLLYVSEDAEKVTLDYSAR